MTPPTRYNYKIYWAEWPWNSTWRKSPKRFKAVQELIPSDAHTVLDIGCGRGWWSECFEGLGYTGIDISFDNYEAAKELYPTKKFINIDVVHFDPSVTWDIVFTSLTLQHIWPELMPLVTRKMKQWGKEIIMLESQGWKSSNGFNHYYDEWFDIEYDHILSGKIHLMKAKGEA